MMLWRLYFLGPGLVFCVLERRNRDYIGGAFSSLRARGFVLYLKYDANCIYCTFHMVFPDFRGDGLETGLDSHSSTGTIVFTNLLLS